jgi:hypothetical protein
MEFDLISFGGTLAVGFAATASLWWLLHTCGLLRTSPLSLADKQLGHVATMTVVAIGMGICLDSLSDEVADTQVLVPYKSVWGADADHKVATLYQVRSTSASPPSWWHPTPLGRQVARLKLLSRYAIGDRERLIADRLEACTIASERVYLTPPSDAQAIFSLSLDDMHAIVKPAYYAAKAKVLTQSTFSDELGQIQQRLVFGRSLCWVGFMTFIAASFAYIWLSLQHGWSLYARKPVTRAKSDTLCRRAALLFVAALMYTVGGFVFSEQEDEYDKRVFGYHYNTQASSGNTPAQSISGYSAQISPGVSGISEVASGLYLACHDAKGPSAIPRLTLYKWAEDHVDYRGSVPIDCKGCYPGPTDIESLSRTTENTILLCESSNYADPLGLATRPQRLFELQLEVTAVDANASLKRCVPLEWPDGLNINVEAMLYLPDRAAPAGTLFLADRGRSGRSTVYRISWPPDKAQGHVRPVEHGNISVAGVPAEWRACSDLALSDDSVMGIATLDAGDGKMGPFASMIYSFPRKALEKGGEIRAEARPLWLGLKAEAICPTPWGYLIGTDDEALGSIIRPLQRGDVASILR